LTDKNNKIDSKMDKHLMYGDFDKIIRFEPIYFDSDTNLMKSTSKEYLQDIKKALKKYQDRELVLTLIGHTDHVQTQTEKINQSKWYPTYPNSLTQDSSKEDANYYATSTQEQLIDLGIPKSIMIVEQRRGLDNLYGTTIEEGRDLNYRVMATLYISKDKNTDSDNDGIIDSMDKCPLTPKGHPVNKDGCSEILNLAVYFDVNSPAIREDSLKKLKKVIAFMKQYPSFKVLLFGHTSSEGTKLDNQILSEKRALSVRKYLVNQGIDSTKISTYGKASTEPIQKAGEPEVRELNRRVEIELY
jgi:outer membrane protein OmpA-like peptidoglycan-associated protein